LYPAKFERISCSYPRDLYKVLIRKPKGKRQCGIGSCRWGSNRKLDLKEIPWEGSYLIHLPFNKDHRQAVVKMVK